MKGRLHPALPLWLPLLFCLSLLKSHLRLQYPLSFCLVSTLACPVIPWSLWVKLETSPVDLCPSSAWSTLKTLLPSASQKDGLCWNGLKEQWIPLPLSLKACHSSPSATKRPCGNRAYKLASLHFLHGALSSILFTNNCYSLYILQTQWQQNINNLATLKRGFPFAVVTVNTWFGLGLINSPPMLVLDDNFLLKEKQICQRRVGSRCWGEKGSNESCSLGHNGLLLSVYICTPHAADVWPSFKDRKMP